MRDITVELQILVEKAEAGLAALESQPRLIRELVIPRIPEASLRTEQE